MPKIICKIINLLKKKNTMQNKSEKKTSSAVEVNTLNNFTIFNLPEHKELVIYKA